jgi:hypothetical protein
VPVGTATVIETRSFPTSLGHQARPATAMPGSAPRRAIRVLGMNALGPVPAVAQPAVSSSLADLKNRRVIVRWFS